MYSVCIVCFLRINRTISQKVNKGQTLFLVPLLSIFLYNTWHFFRQSITCFFQKHKFKFCKNEKIFYSFFFKNANSNFVKTEKFWKGVWGFFPNNYKKSALKVEHSFYKISQHAIMLLCLQKVKERVCFSSRMGCRG